MIGSDDDIPEFFDASCTPALEELTLDSSLDFSTLEPPLWPYLAQFLARSQPPLKSLSLLSIHMGVDDIISCLQHAPQLATLSGDRVLFQPEIMDALTPSLEPARIAICPKLTTISLKVSQDDFSALAAMICARWAISRHQHGENPTFFGVREWQNTIWLVFPPGSDTFFRNTVLIALKSHSASIARNLSMRQNIVPHLDM
ncbi:hypothetical protein BD410DRAFT_846551 [Rickenella mellea]|uniref:F-box domain-containing protein n=1 Tax=Rickenella mellea TaxID=50990 RepID=A0A4Y7PGA6_9AGAM|nr:hypothetical protein BD410DRAFT_846551 [Rickenella mellea]